MSQSAFPARSPVSSHYTACPLVDFFRPARSTGRFSPPLRHVHSFSPRHRSSTCKVGLAHLNDGLACHPGLSVVSSRYFSLFAPRLSRFFGFFQRRLFFSGCGYQFSLLWMLSTIFLSDSFTIQIIYQKTSSCTRTERDSRCLKALAGGAVRRQLF